jgi:hypothetical protein
MTGDPEVTELLPAGRRSGSYRMVARIERPSAGPLRIAGYMSEWLSTRSIQSLAQKARWAKTASNKQATAARPKRTISADPRVAICRNVVKTFTTARRNYCEDTTSRSSSCPQPIPTRRSGRCSPETGWGHAASSQHSPRTSACEPYREAIELGLSGCIAGAVHCRYRSASRGRIDCVGSHV